MAPPSQRRASREHRPLPHEQRPRGKAPVVVVSGINPDVTEYDVFQHFSQVRDCTGGDYDETFMSLLGV